MIAYKGREGRRRGQSKMTKNLERVYLEGKCRECSVAVTRMDFAKILGKFTKVKIQYESSSTPKTKKSTEVTSPTNTRLKSNENGMVLLHRNAYNQHPVKDAKKSKAIQPASPRPVSNILKENNSLKKTVVAKDKKSNNNIKDINSNLKKYAIIFVDPTISNKNDHKNHITLVDLLPNINKDILPTEEWCIEYFPKLEELKEDKVYDRIAAELEDLMYSEKKDVDNHKVDDFPSIMDILNDNTESSGTKTGGVESKLSLESSDVEAMLLGKGNSDIKESEPIPMEVDNPSDVSKLIDDVNHQQNSDSIVDKSENDNKQTGSNEINHIENPPSPSILDEALQGGIEQHLPIEQSHKESTLDINDPSKESDNNNEKVKCDITNSETLPKNVERKNSVTMTPLTSDSTSTNYNFVTHVIFKKMMHGTCYKTVTCPKNLKYSIKIQEKSIEFLGAPKYITSLEDLQVLLQIVNESELQSFNVLH